MSEIKSERTAFIQAILRVFPVILLLLFTLVAAPTFAQQKVTPDHVYAKVRELSVLVERIRYHMGAPKAGHLELSVENAQPHDVFFQALTLHRKSNRLLFQVTRRKGITPEVPRGVYRPADVLELTVGALRNIAGVLEGLGLPTSVLVVSMATGDKVPSDVFMAIQALNRQINLLLDRRFAPSDVYMQVTLAIGYSARQLARFPDATRIPTAPEVEPGRLPSDVFFRLLEALEQISRIYESEGLSSLHVDATRVDREDVAPSDVFDIASLLVARLDFLHKYKGITKMPRGTYYPGRMYPTDVYRQAGILLSQLDTLIKISHRKEQE